MSNTADKIKVLHFTSHLEDCGVSTYMENYFESMANINDIQNKVFGVSPYQTRPMSYKEMTPVVNRLIEELGDYDILHIQHEFGLFWHDQFLRLVDAGKRAGKKVVVTFHLSPEVAIKPVVLGGYGPKNVVRFVKLMRHRLKMKSYHTTPLKLADAVVVHNEITQKSLERFGVDPEKIQVIPHPVYKAPKLESKEISENLNRKKNDLIFCVSGFLHRYKGVTAAVKSLKYLPENYKLALIGGVKADSDQVTYEDDVTDLIDQLGLRDRVYITGFVQDHEKLKSMIAECDVAVFPYDRVFYANQSTGSINLAFSSGRPIIAYPTEVIKEVAREADGAIVLCETFAYYELARQLKSINLEKQSILSRAFARRMAWPNAARKLVDMYRRVVED